MFSDLVFKKVKNLFNFSLLCIILSNKTNCNVLQCMTLDIMFLEVMTVLVRQSSHFRVTRALRPIFLVDTKCFGGVRRFIRQILLTLPPILDMLGLLLFFITLYTVLGYYMFSEMNRNFSTLQDSFVSLFVLLTTAK